MAKMTKTTVDSMIRKAIFSDLDLSNREGYEKINDRCFGVLVTDENGVERYARVSVVVAAIREDCSARDLMKAEIDDYNEKQAAKAEKAAARAEKAKRDKAKREAAAKKAAEGEAEEE